MYVGGEKFPILKFYLLQKTTKTQTNLYLYSIIIALVF